MNLKDNVERVKERITNAQQRSGNKASVKIVAITKTHPASIISDVRNVGLDSIGENRIQEAEDKFLEPRFPAKRVANLFFHVPAVLAVIPCHHRRPGSVLAPYTYACSNNRDAH